MAEIIPPRDVVVCDGCGVESSVDPRLHSMHRDLLAEAGWRSDVARDDDHCPSCVQAVDSERGGALD